MKLKERTKLFWLFAFLVIFIISVVIYAICDFSLYNFTVSKVYPDTQYMEAEKNVYMTMVNEEENIVEGYFPVTYIFHVKDVKIIDMDNKEIKLSDIEVGDNIQVITKDSLHQLVPQFSNYERYIVNIVLVKLISKGNA